jgi:hypothetical protein
MDLQPHWLGPAAWFASLILSLTSVLLSSSAAFIFNAIRNPPRKIPLRKQLAIIMAVEGVISLDTNLEPPLPKSSTMLPENLDRVGEPESIPEVDESRAPSVHVRWNMVFTWQAPIMLMSYSMLGFAAGLIVYVTTPLYKDVTVGGHTKVIHVGDENQSLLNPSLPSELFMQMH